MSRKKIVQLLASLVILSCMVLPVQAAPQVNIVPLIQLLLLSPTEIELPDGFVGLWGLDENGKPVNKNAFFTDEDKLCLRTVLELGPTEKIHLKLEWFIDGAAGSWYTPLDGDFKIEAPSIVTLDSCMIDTSSTDPSNPPLNPPPSPNWKVVVSIDGVPEETHPFVLQNP